MAQRIGEIKTLYMTTYYFPVKDIKTNAPKGVLRVLQFDGGKSNADYFPHVLPGVTELDGFVPTVHVEFEDGESVLKIVTEVISVLPENKIDS
jgi:hypothetical protein